MSTREGKVHPTPEAREKYLKEHPGKEDADKKFKEDQKKKKDKGNIELLRRMQKKVADRYVLAHSLPDFWMSQVDVATFCPPCAAKMASLNIRQVKASVFFGSGAMKEASDKVAEKWKSLPKGWTEESLKSFWDSLTGDVKHKVTKCIKEMEGKVDDPGAFCAAARDRIEGKEWRSEERTASKVADRYLQASYAKARAEILKYLQKEGWNVKPNLKVPHATSPDGELRLWFKPQAVYYTHGNNHTLGGARTVSYDFDYRKMSGPEFVKEIERRLKVKTASSNVAERWLQAQADVIPREVAILKKLRKGDQVRIEAPRLKKPRVVTVTEVDVKSNDVSVYTSSGHTRPGHMKGGLLTYRPSSYGSQVMYQPTPLQQIIEVTRITKL